MPTYLTPVKLSDLVLLTGADDLVGLAGCTAVHVERLDLDPSRESWALTADDGGDRRRVLGLAVDRPAGRQALAWLAACVRDGVQVSDLSKLLREPTAAEAQALSGEAPPSLPPAPPAQAVAATPARQQPLTYEQAVAEATRQALAAVRQQSALPAEQAAQPPADPTDAATVTRTRRPAVRDLFPSPAVPEGGGR